MARVQLEGREGGSRFRVSLHFQIDALRCETSTGVWQGAAILCCGLRLIGSRRRSIRSWIPFYLIKLILNARALDATNNLLSCNIVTSYKSCSSTSPTPTLFPSRFEFEPPFEFSTGTALRSGICCDVVLRTAPTSNAVASELPPLTLLTESRREEGAAGFEDGAPAVIFSSMANIRACCSLTCAVHRSDKVRCRACGTYFDDLLQNVIFRMKRHSGLGLRDTS